jgi:hypothetical protein
MSLLVPFVMTVQSFLYSSNMFPNPPPPPPICLYFYLYGPTLPCCCFHSQHNNKSTTYFIQSKNHSTNLLTFFRKMHSKGSQRGFKFYTYPLLAVHCQNNSNFILSCGLNIFITICVGDEPTFLILRVWTCGYWYINISNSASTYAHTDCDKIWIRCQANSFVCCETWMTYIMDFI